MLWLIKTSLIILVLASSLLVSLWIARLTSDELVLGRKYFRGVLFVSAALALVVIDSWILGFIAGSIALSVVLTLSYLCIVSFVSLRQAIKR